MTRRRVSRDIAKLSSGLILAGQFVSNNSWYVSSVAGSDTTGDGSFEKPYATIAAALANIPALPAVSDIEDFAILVKPKHAEAISAAAALTISKSGVRIIGLGQGSYRPTLTWGTSTAAQIIISGANVSFENFIFDFTGIDAVVAAFSVTGAGVKFINNRFNTNSASAGVVLGILTAATASGLVIKGNQFVGPATNSGTTTTACIKHEVGVDYVIEDNYFAGKMTQAILNATALLRGSIHNNRFVIATGTVAITMHASSTPFISSNFINVSTGTTPITAAAGFVAGNRYSAAAGVTAGTALTI